jgi:phage-related minor tail protein
MSTVQTDYAGIIVQSWTDIDNGVMTHMENIVNQTESLSQGIVGIISDMTKSIEKMMVDMLYKQYVMKPIQSWFSSIVGGMLGGSIGGTNIPTAALTAQNNMLGAFSGSYADYKNPFKFASGGSYPGGMALVGEQGPELINFNRPGQVYTAGQTQQMMSGGTTSSVSVTLINNTGTATTATATSSYDGAVRAYIIDVVLDKATRDSTFRAAFGGAR